MDFTQACSTFVARYRQRTDYEREVAERDLSNKEERKACERQLFELNEGIAAAAEDIHDALRELFEEGRAAMAPPDLFQLSRREVLPYRDKICVVVERLQVLSKLRS